MASTVTTNMGLIVPTVGQEPGPAWANDINADLGILDQHNHTSGQGATIPTAGINMNADLSLNDFNLTEVQTVNYQNLSGSLAGTAPNLGCTYQAANELYFNDGNGNVVKITSGGSVNAGAGSITGLPSGTASASFSAGTFIWQSATNTAAKMDFGAAVFRNSSASSKGLTLSPPNAMAADLAQTLPTTPAATSFMTMDSSGNMGATIATAAGIGTSNIANGAITSAKLAAGLLPGTGTPTTITSSQNYTVPSGVNYLYVLACGGGGGAGGGGWGGSGSGSGGISGGGGGAGAPVWQGIIPVTPGNTYAVTIGAGGAGGSAAGSNPANGGSGSQGGTTSFGAVMSVHGGLAGSGGTSSGNGGAGGTGRGYAGQRGSLGSSGVAGGVGWFSDTWDGAGGTGHDGVTSSGGGFGGSGGGSLGSGGAQGVAGGANTGGGGGGGNGGIGANAASAGQAGGSGKMLIYIV